MQEKCPKDYRGEKVGVDFPRGDTSGFRKVDRLGVRERLEQVSFRRSTWRLC